VWGSGSPCPIRPVTPDLPDVPKNTRWWVRVSRSWKCLWYAGSRWQSAGGICEQAVEATSPRGDSIVLRPAHSLASDGLWHPIRRCRLFITTVQPSRPAASCKAVVGSSTLVERAAHFMACMERVAISSHHPGNSASLMSAASGCLEGEGPRMDCWGSPAPPSPSACMTQRIGSADMGGQSAPSLCHPDHGGCHPIATTLS
jgi:hypothetical protein